MNKETDVAIIGAGPIGLACGIEAKRRKIPYTIIEKGCLVNSIYKYPANMTFFSTSDRLEIGDVPFISHNNKPTRSEALEYYRRVADFWKLDLHLYEEVLDIFKKPDGRFEIDSRSGSYTAQNIILSTGFYDKPNLLNVKGEDLAKVKHYYDDPHPYFKQKVIVVGAANSAVDVALEIYRKGGDVTMVIRESQLRNSVKYWARPDIENRIKEGSIRSFFNSEIEEIKPHSVLINTPEGIEEVANDFVLAMTGYQPDFDFLMSMGIEFNIDEYHTPVHNPETMESNVEGLYLAGVVCGGLKTNQWFIENSRAHAHTILSHIDGKKMLENY